MTGCDLPAFERVGKAAVAIYIFHNDASKFRTEENIHDFMDTILHRFCKEFLIE
jgi:hypothetical protein